MKHAMIRGDSMILIFRVPPLARGHGLYPNNLRSPGIAELNQL